MKINTVISAILVVGCTIFPIVGALAYDAYLTRGMQEILVRAPEKGNFHPRVVNAVAGQPTTLRIRNIDAVMHGFAVPGLNLDVGELKAGHVKIVEFTPETPGSYDFYCTVWCSEFHLQMRGVIEVAAPD